MHWALDRRVPTPVDLMEAVRGRGPTQPHRVSELAVELSAQHSLTFKLLCSRHVNEVDLCTPCHDCGLF